MLKHQKWQHWWQLVGRAQIYRTVKRILRDIIDNLFNLWKRVRIKLRKPIDGLRIVNHHSSFLSVPAHDQYVRPPGWPWMFNGKPWVSSFSTSAWINSRSSLLYWRDLIATGLHSGSNNSKKRRGRTFAAATPSTFLKKLGITGVFSAPPIWKKQLLCAAWETVG